MFFILYIIIRIFIDNYLKKLINTYMIYTLLFKKLLTVFELKSNL